MRTTAAVFRPARYEDAVAGGAGRYDALAPVPLHPRRLLDRGFNQSRELARLIAARHDLPIWDHALRRVRRTIPQMRAWPARNGPRTSVGPLSPGRGRCPARPCFWWTTS